MIEGFKQKPGMPAALPVLSVCCQHGCLILSHANAIVAVAETAGPHRSRHEPGGTAP